jgi:hypothetical protein
MFNCGPPILKKGGERRRSSPAVADWPFSLRLNMRRPEPMSLLAIKLIVTPLVVLLASLAARRWGDAIAGWLVGLPLTSAPVSVFLAIEQGPSFAAQAADGSIAGVLSQAAFCLGYAALSRQGLAVALGGGTLAYAASATALVAAGLPSAVLFAAAIVALTFVLWSLPRRAVIISANAIAWWDLPLRMAVTTGLVVGLTSAAAALGPGASGVTASFPLIGASIAVFAHFSQGPEAGVAVLRGMVSALYAFAAFFVIIGAALPRASLLAAFALATAGCLIVQGATLRLQHRSPKMEDAAEGGPAASSLHRG